MSRTASPYYGMKRTRKDALSDYSITESVEHWFYNPVIACACPGGPPPFGCGCRERYFVDANAVLAALALVSILKSKDLTRT